MWKDVVVEEIRAIREAHARQYNYDIRAIFRALKEEEKKADGKQFLFSRNLFCRSNRMRKNIGVSNTAG